MEDGEGCGGHIHISFQIEREAESPLLIRDPICRCKRHTISHAEVLSTYLTKTLCPILETHIYGLQESEIRLGLLRDAAYRIKGDTHTAYFEWRTLPTWLAHPIFAFCILSLTDILTRTYLQRLLDDPCGLPYTLPKVPTKSAEFINEILYLAGKVEGTHDGIRNLQYGLSKLFSEELNWKVHSYFTTDFKWRWISREEVHSVREKWKIRREPPLIEWGADVRGYKHGDLKTPPTVGGIPTDFDTDIGNPRDTGTRIPRFRYPTPFLTTPFPDPPPGYREEQVEEGRDAEI